MTQSSLLDGITERYLREAGVALAMRVLDLGTSPPLVGAFARVAA